MKEIDRSTLKCFQEYNINQQPLTNIIKKRNSLLNQNLIIRNSNQTETFIPQPISTFKIYKCVRNSTTNLKGKRLHFQFFLGDYPTFHAKIKPWSNSTSIGISKGLNSHINGDHDATLLHTNDFCDFSLRIGNALGMEVLSFQFRESSNNIIKPRKLKIYFFGENLAFPNLLESSDPKFTEEGLWVIDLNSKDVIGSIKNCRIEDVNHFPYIFIRKISQDVLDIESSPIIDPLFLFSLSIGSFLCKL